MTAHTCGIFSDSGQCQCNTGIVCRLVRIQLTGTDIIPHIGYNAIIVTVIVAVQDIRIAACQCKDGPFAAAGTDCRRRYCLFNVGKSFSQILAVIGFFVRLLVFKCSLSSKQFLIDQRADSIFLLVCQGIIRSACSHNSFSIGLCNRVGQGVDQTFNTLNFQLGNLCSCVRNLLPHSGADFAFTAEFFQLIQCCLRIRDGLLVCKRQVGRILRELVCGGCNRGNRLEYRHPLHAGHELVIVT